MLHEQDEITQTVACNLLHEKNGTNQTTWLNVRSLLGHFYPFIKINRNVFRASRCTLRESKTWLNQRRIQRVARTRRNYPDNVACNLLHEKDGIKQTMCLKARSLLGHFYPSTKMNGKVFRASRCTLRESKTWLNQRRIQRVARTRRNYPDNVACNLLHEKDGIKQTMCLKARSLLGHFYPSTKMNGKVFRASRCTLREIQNVIKPTSCATCCTNKAKLPRP